MVKLNFSIFSLCLYQTVLKKKSSFQFWEFMTYKKTMVTNSGLTVIKEWWAVSSKIALILFSGYFFYFS